MLEQDWKAVEVLRGLGLPAAKSAALLGVFLQTGVRRAAVVFERVMVGPEPRKQVAAEPKPT